MSKEERMLKITLLSVTVLYGLLDGAYSMTMPPTPPIFVTIQPGCHRNGKFYKEGSSFKPSPCEWCQCVQGRAQCAIADCFIVQCVDSYNDPTKCCPVCPNGRNCYAGNKVIPAGKDVHINEHTICRCPDQFGFGMTAHRAVCKDIMTTTMP